MPLLGLLASALVFLARGWTALRTAAAIALLVALFLPWQEMHASARFHAPGLDGWSAYGGAMAGDVALLLVAAPTLPVLEAYVLEAVLALGFLVSAQRGFFADVVNSRIFRMGYRLYAGFAATGLLLIATLVPLRLGQVDRRRALVRALPVGLSLGCVSWTIRATAVRDWLSVPALFLALCLTRSWILATKRPIIKGHTLTLAPLALLVLPALELVRLRSTGIIWGGVILIALCVVLAALGRLEESGGGLESFRVPEEIWRVDRLPEPES